MINTTKHPPTPAEPARRPMVFRHHNWAKSLARRLAALGVSPNSVSLASIVFSLIAAACLVYSRWTSNISSAWLLITVPVLIALRGICNLIDGMIAVEGGRRTKSGEVFNDFPDRISDVALFVGAGYCALEASWGVPLGWLAAVCAVIVAYTRMLGGALGAKQYFSGPMGKPARMAVLSLGCIGAAIERLAHESTWSIIICLSVIAAGCLVTAVRRARQIIRELESA